MLKHVSFDIKLCSKYCFYRIENEETRSKKGSGLGLFISKQFILLHGGKIEYERNMPTGSVFKISLPL